MVFEVIKNNSLFEVEHLLIFLLKTIQMYKATDVKIKQVDNNKCNSVS